jgi:hypothetical protein
LASRDSFQKRQKEAARREKRQLKLNRRQGRQLPHSETSSENDVATNPVDPTATAPLSAPDTASAESLSTVTKAADPPGEHRTDAFKPASSEPEPPRTDSPPREP